MAAAKQPPLRPEDRDILNRILDAMSTAGKERARNKYGDDTKILRTCWEGYHLLEYAKTIRGKKFKNRKTTLQDELDFLLERKISGDFKKVQDMPSANSKSGLDARVVQGVFEALAEVQGKYDLVCIVEYMEYCLKSERVVEQFEVETTIAGEKQSINGENLTKTIASIRSYILQWEAANSTQAEASSNLPPQGSTPELFFLPESFDWSAAVLQGFSHIELQSDVRPWRPINHSAWVINLKPVRPEICCAVMDALRINYSQYCWDSTDIQQIQEESSSLNFRVTADRGKQVFLFRVQLRITSDDAINELHAFSREIVESKVFSELGHVLLPQQTANGKDYAQHHKKLVSLYGFVENASHFNPVFPEWAAVGEALAKIQNVIEKSDLSSLELEIVRQDITPVLEPIEHIDSMVKEAKDAVKFRAKNCEFSELFLQKEMLVRAAYLRASELDPMPPSQRRRLLSDVHPHNTFWRNEKCTLIYDFEAIGKSWPEEASICFFLHRFSRERIRAMKEQKAFDPVTRGIKEAELCLSYYAANRTNTDSIPSISDFGRWVLWTNLIKVCFLHARHHNRRYDERSDLRVRAELSKMLGMLEEGLELHAALNH